MLKYFLSLFLQLLFKHWYRIFSLILFVSILFVTSCFHCSVIDRKPMGSKNRATAEKCGILHLSKVPTLLDNVTRKHEDNFIISFERWGTARHDWFLTSLPCPQTQRWPDSLGNSLPTFWSALIGLACFMVVFGTSRRCFWESVMRSCPCFLPPTLLNIALDAQSSAGALPEAIFQNNGR